MNSLLPSQLYITEAAESKKKAEQELNIPDPAQTVTVAELIHNDTKNNANSSESHGK